MFRIFLKIAFRHLWETRPFTIVNIIGLSVGTVWLLALPGFAAILIVFFIVCILGKRAVSNDPASELRSS
ncbi:hypothetical protein DSL64_01555 [Dyadobacter luteus]|uniref:Uncharacterized protein n=1 Tax=Dyadobacter luteus TaxID=2259619 RepID=A0A3D8YHG5_9BACT|nr:hypothetical protein DSL64_01555 [Dyadobacter luteus]